MGNPALACAWLFQRSMSVKVGQVREARGRRGEVSGTLPSDHVNRLLATNFRVMSFLGDRVLRPFLQVSDAFFPSIQLGFTDAFIGFRVWKGRSLSTDSAVF